jgi:hypothetical protein
MYYVQSLRLKLGDFATTLLTQLLVSYCCLTPTQQFVQLYHDENKLIFNEMMMRSAFY